MREKDEMRKLQKLFPRQFPINWKKILLNWSLLKKKVNFSFIFGKNLSSASNDLLLFMLFTEELLRDGISLGKSFECGTSWAFSSVLWNNRYEINLKS